MDQAELYGWLASVFTTIIFLPQLVKAFQTKMTNDISMLMLFLSVLGNGFWFVHASMIGNMPLLVCALLIILISVTLIVFKYLNERSIN